MCGISIIISNTNSKVDEKLIKSFNNKVCHRGPDDEGFYFGENFAFGHRRLSILDLSEGGHQPQHRSNLWITYNGEIYNYLELRQELKELGHVFRTESDTEVILAAYQEWGVESFSKLNGMWAFALADLDRKEILLCRDHFGIKPLYYSNVGSFFLAGSEIKQFLVVPGFSPELNKAVAVNFLVNGLLNYSDQTFFKGVSELRPGHYIRYNLDNHTRQVICWYDLDKAAIPVTDDFDTAVEKVRKLFAESVKIRMRSDVRVGSCLSGGLDSSSIVSIIASQQLANSDFATVTSCFADLRYDEQRFSDQVTSQTGFHAHKIFPQLDDLVEKGVLDMMIYHQDQPFSTASHFSEYKVFEKARIEKMIVMQDGQGSDEYLCGYPEFFNARIKELISSFAFKSAASLLLKMAAHKNRGFVSELFRFLRSEYIYSGIVAMKQLAGSNNYSWLNSQWQSIAKDQVVNANYANIRDLSILQIRKTSIPYQLHSEDRNSMLFSVESRLPFLDHRLVEYCIGLPSSYKINNGYSKRILREAITELPEVVKQRKDKMGFVAPDSLWMLNNKENVYQDLEAAVQSLGVFSNTLLSRFNEFTEGKLGYEPIYFRAMTFARFCKMFNVKVD